MTRFLRLSLPALTPVLAALLLASCTSRVRRHGGSSTDNIDPRWESYSRDELTSELARLRVERDRYAETNVVLQDELQWAHEDLRLVERQFVRFEERLATDYGKASAVSAVAEARMRYDETRRRYSSLPDSTGQNIVGLVNTADVLIRKANYPAALFFAERANHTMISFERRLHLDVDSVARTVSVSTANLREGPGQHYTVMEKLARGEQVVCTDSVREWYHVRTPRGTVGWVHVSVLE